ncbi:unnamed protein product [Dracunculus medinensis]|uniref:Uncharacterized protein n=1 Tax=Dracunculus medinensis TaxID=318479 RepID=A0A0N4UI76_DRAME|nr:unnamed protein product [Dracunculus medinensis]
MLLAFLIVVSDTSASDEQLNVEEPQRTIHFYCAKKCEAELGENIPDVRLEQYCRLQCKYYCQQLKEKCK